MKYQLRTLLVAAVIATPAVTVQAESPPAASALSIKTGGATVDRYGRASADASQSGVAPASAVKTAGADVNTYGRGNPVVPQSATSSGRVVASGMSVQEYGRGTSALAGVPSVRSDKINIGRSGGKGDRG
jgi:hypothetical protein